MSASEHTQPSEETVVSPFSDSAPHRSRPRKKRNAPVMISLAVILVVALGVGGFLLSNTLIDPLRTLEPFPVGKYLDSYRPLAGLKFRASLRVENDHSVLYAFNSFQ